ncbi:murein biosynthesis integral membrane protein MurJ [Tessaracoccus antarcticus]|uniref:Murein biosynthesis integral membrane protein MurJ n=1 Tax=Tessaracoccus antarcticus TaxID=2479848 RepID=A0A3M0GIG6_9ACTN|nr:murein biosynthesis integral membrane protein MurJ [Tessaracoccus antarcticus]RMB61403.1 murein biosynthesis integral membrane protein MurJ [Tessaracoccus antarcticus]
MSSQVSTTKKLVSASALMASGTLISRILGLVRVMLIVFILGNTTRQADIFSLATSVPNSLYILFAGGALNTVLVPQIVRAIKHDDDGGEAYTNRIMTAFMLIVGVVAVLVTLAAPVVTTIYSGAQWRAPELADQYASMVALTYLTLPQVFFYGVFFLLGQVLNARDKFGPMMWAPIANNVIAILVLSTYLVVWGSGGDHSGAFTTAQIWTLGLGSTVGIAVQTAVLLPYLRKVGFTFRPRFDLKGTGLGKTFSLTKWTLGFVAVNQLALVVVQRLATAATAEGAQGGAGLTVYSNAHLLWILPHSLITVSLATAMLPNASRLAASRDMVGVAAEATKTMRLALVALVPATVGFIALAAPITQLLFGGGRGAQDSQFVALTLIAFAVGLVPFTVQFVCLRTYYAMENTRTPFFLQCVIAAVNAGGALLLVWWAGDPNLSAPALALSYSLAYTIGVVLSWRLLKRDVPALDGADMGLHIVRLVLGASLGGIGAYFAARGLLGAFQDSKVGALLAVFAGLAIIGIVYAVVGKLLQVRELSSVTELLRTRLGRGRRSSNAVSDEPQDIEHDLPSSGAIAEDMMPTQVHAAIQDDEEPTEAPTPWDPESMVDTAIRPAIIDDVAPGDIDDDRFDATTGDTDAGDAVEEPAEQDAPLLGESGELLSTRYRLEEPMARRAGIESWRAHDLQLSRDVLAHVMPAGDPRIPAVLDAARTGASATDSRFLRVLDAVAIDDGGAVGGYVVCEFAAGKPLSQLLGKEQLSTLEAAWIVRELADALSAMHVNGLFHEQVTPENVIITSSGAVRLVGFGVESVLAQGERPSSWSAKESSDVTAMAALLYALLSNHWPGTAAWGLPAAPVIGGALVGPRRLRADVPARLDRICTTILTDREVAGESRITTAAQLASALASVLGTADPSPDLEDRIRYGGDSTATPSPLAVAGSAALHQSLHGEAFAEAATHEFIPEDAEPVRESPLEEQRRLMSTGRPALWIIAALAVGTLVVTLVVVASQRAGQQDAGPEITTSASASQTPGGQLAIVAGADFDPQADGGNDEENTPKVPLAFDDDPATGWATLEYHNRPNLGGLKPGVGIVLDLGENRDVSSVEVLFAAPGATVELRVPTEAGVDAAPMASQSEWTVVASQADAPGTTTLTPDAATNTRYLLLYLTNLPEVSTSRYQAQINNVVVNG